MVEKIRKEKPEYYCIIYTGDVGIKSEQILSKAKDRFGIDLLNNDEHIQFCYITTRKFVEAETYPKLTILGQSVGAMLLALEALSIVNPDIVIDTMGYSFTLPVFRFLGGCKVGCYVHYPTISTDMLRRVSSADSASPLRNLKILYYQVFSVIYGIVGKSSKLVWTNSNWTKAHINHLWRIPSRTHILYPPCNIQQFSTFPLQGEEEGNVNALQERNGEIQNSNSTKRDKNLIISIAQFRPEKNHALQLQSLKYLLDHFNENGDFNNIQLVLIGSCRNAEDEGRIQKLRDLAHNLGIEKNVAFEINVNFQTLCDWMKRAQFGLHTMWCEHFGIGIVELMASGVVVVAHNSGGPKTDIVVPEDGQITGMLAATAEEYAECLHNLLVLPEEELHQIQIAARKHVAKFSDEKFEEGFYKTVSTFL